MWNLQVPIHAYPWQPMGAHANFLGRLFLVRCARRSGAPQAVHAKPTKKSRTLWAQRPELIQRLTRLKARRKARQVARFVMRRFLPIKERQRRNALIGALSEVAKQAAMSKRSGFASSSVIFNVALFILIAERDIQAIKIDALTHPDPWKRSLCARVILLTIHEWDMDKVTGNKLKGALDDVGASDELRNRATDALRSLRAVQRKAQKEFAFLRNATIAHRDPDALAQYHAITHIDEMAVLKLASDFYTAADIFISLVPELLIRTSTIPGLLRQLVNRSTRGK